MHNGGRPRAVAGTGAAAVPAPGRPCVLCRVGGVVHTAGPQTGRGVGSTGRQVDASAGGRDQPAQNCSTQYGATVIQPLPVAPLSRPELVRARVYQDST